MRPFRRASLALVTGVAAFAAAGAAVAAAAPATAHPAVSPQNAGTRRTPTAAPVAGAGRWRR